MQQISPRIFRVRQGKHIGIMRKRMKALRIAIAVSFALGAIPLFAATGNAEANGFQEIVNAAKKEAAQGPFVVFASNPREEKTRQALFDAFKKRYGMPDFKFEWLELHPSVAVPRTITEIKAGKSGPSVLMSSASTLLELDHAGFLDPYDWVSNFSAEFHDIKEAAADRVPAELKGKWVVIYDATRSWVFNTQQLKASEVPDSIEAVADPKWARKFAMNASGGSPFDLFSLVWGEERALNTVKKLMANRPLYKKGTPAVNNAVAAGEAVLGFGSIHESERLKVQGAPIDWKPYGEYIPVLSQGYSVSKKAAQPNLGRLFIAWLAMDGMKIYEDMEVTTRVTRKDSPLYKLIKQRAPNAKVLEPKNEKDFKAFDSVNEKLDKLLTTAAVGK